MANIFLLLSTVANEEDYFTACWDYLIDNLPSIGQQIVDVLFSHIGQPSPKFIKASKHPYLSNKNYPDFLFECEGINIICEHKLSSGLGKRQLERYLDLAIQQSKKTYLAFISQEQYDISSDVYFSDRYLHPIDRKHFLWQDLYPSIATHEERLAQEFSDFMYTLGMTPSKSIIGWEDLFTNPETVKVFKQQWEKVRSHFLSIGAQKCYIHSRNKYSFNISYPLPWLHLIYLYLDEQYLTLNANIWLHQNSPYLNAFKDVNDNFLSLDERQIFVGDGKLMQASWTLTDNTSPLLALQYSTDLYEILHPNSLITQQALLNFSTAVFAHVQKIVLNK